MDFPKILNAILGALIGLVIVIVISDYLDPEPIRAQCANIVDHGRIVGERCTYDGGSLLESIELTPEACFDKVRQQRGDEYAISACYPNDSSIGKGRYEY